ncbi:MAG: pilus assembly protein [Firmicutes bacterium]|nr:pilus assembly protein [Bacillota bacterium]
MSNNSSKNKGSLTVEASIVLPFFICVILTIGFFIRIVHTHEVIQYAIDETANDIASYSYIYYSSDFFDMEKKLEESTNYPNVWNRKDDHDEIEKITEEIKRVINKKSHSSNSLELLFKLLSNIKEFNIEKVIEDLDTVGKIELINYIKNQVGNVIANKQIEDYILPSFNGSLEEKLKKLNIVTKSDNGLDLINGIDISKSRYLKENNEIEIIATYKINLPLPIDFIGDIPIIQRASTRAWMGGNNPSLKKETIVYITRTGECYHKDGCYHLRQSKIPVKLSVVLAEGKYRPCSHCIGNN